MKYYNKGFSLVELMVAMALSLFIILGLFYSVLSDMRAYESARATQGIVTKSRMTMQTLRLYIQQAGFRDAAALITNTSLPASTSSDWQWEEGQILQGTTSSTAFNDEKINSDIIAVRFSGADVNGIVSCDGTDLTTDDTHQITLYVNNANELMCQDDAETALLLDQDVEFLELLYGTTENQTRYFTASNVSDWSTVNRVKIGLLLSQEVAGNSLINSNDYSIFNQTISAANDTNFRRVVMDTVLIENQGN